MIVGAYDSWKRGMTHVQMGNNKNLSDKTYVGNVALALVLASDKLGDASLADQVGGEVFFINNNDPRHFWSFMRSVWAGFDEIFPEHPKNQKKPFVIPRTFALLLAYVMKFLGWIKGKPEQTLTPYTVKFTTAVMYFNTEKAKRLLGYEPEVGVDDGIKKTMAVCIYLTSVGLKCSLFFSGSRPSRRRVIDFQFRLNSFHISTIFYKSSFTPS
jgi:sterol-4alpha-carboxylate 3-dehydrogenase (decarboxylating)